MDVRINNQNICFMCDINPRYDTHHALPRHLRPMNNVELPVCEKCHKKINSLDVAAVIPFIHKQIMINNEVNVKLGEIVKLIEKAVKNQKKK